MISLHPTLLALDFDGVVCDGMIEYFQSTWRAYCQLWPPADSMPSEALALKFYQTRPVIETGWEMPILVRALVLGISESEILSHWFEIRDRILAETGLTAQDLNPLVDGVRDQWIAEDLSGWLSLHRFYPGVIEQLKKWLESSLQILIITTKEERFVRSLLEQQGVEMPLGSIFGKGCQRSKADILQEFLTATQPQPIIWFVEDRLKTLESVIKQPNLAEVQLFLADWGYNTASDRELATQISRIHLLSLCQFSEDFPIWLKAYSRRQEAGDRRQE